MKSKVTHWIVYCFTRFQDGHEEHTKLFSNIDDAMAYINKLGDGWGCQNEWHLCEVGKEIPLENYKVEEAEPVKVKTVTKYKIKDK